MEVYQQYQEYLNNGLFAGIPYRVELKGDQELRDCPYVDQRAVMEIFQIGRQLSAADALNGEGPVIYKPIKENNQVRALLLVFEDVDCEEKNMIACDVLQGLAEIAADYVGSERMHRFLERENDVLNREMKVLFDTVTQPFCLVNEEGVIQEVNDNLASLAHKRRALLIGEQIDALVSGESWRRMQEADKKEQMMVQLELQSGQKMTATVQPVTVNKKKKGYLLVLNEDTVKAGKVKQGKSKLYHFREIKGVSDALQQAVQAAKRVSKSDASIILRGESGTGKELFAQSIHNESERKHQRFVALNCAAIPENLLESELFGHEKGAFTGAAKEKPGRFELADKGTLFLDEIGDMSLYLQAKLLRVIQEQTIERVGAEKSKKIDVRIITATHQPLEQLVKEGKFRQDLYYRISVIPITIPPLRERKEDLPILIDHFMKLYSKEMNRYPKQLSDEVYQTLYAYGWPGNIRELQNVIRHFVELEIGDVVTLKSLPAAFLKKETMPEKQMKSPIRAVPRYTGRMEKNELIEVLDHNGWHTEGKKKAAEELGISLPTLYRWMKKLKIK
ncbi:sigma-54 interaction domain-containing protein [Bacillus sp. 1P06AnD]|uniref:sigma-54 interaction domain-containing protein n=1 Tax=Bacillus sp. 1P06AnD TaxID=3132208 RepID=UPI0039A12E4D